MPTIHPFAPAQHHNIQESLTFIFSESNETCDASLLQTQRKKEAGEHCPASTLPL